MSLNPMTWPLAGKILGVGVSAVVVGSGVTYAAIGGGGGTTPVPAASSAPLSHASSPALSTASPTPSTPSGLLAGCQVGEGTGSSFLPVTQQNIGDGDSAYQITVTNNTSAAVTVSGFGVTFSAFGSRIGADQSTVDTALMEPGERWDFPIGMTGGVRVSVNTFLNTTCTVTAVDTENGTVAPTVIPEQNGVANTHDQDVQQAQQQLAADVSTLVSDSDSLNTNNTLASDVKTMLQEYGSERQDWKAEQQGNCQDGGLNYGPVTGDASAVGGYYNALKSDISALQSGPGTSIAQVQQDLAALQGEVSTLQGLGATPSQDPSSAVAAGNQALRNAASAISWAQGQGNSIDGQAKQLAASAEDYFSSHCG